MSIKIKLPYDFEKPNEFLQNYQEIKYIKLHEDDTKLTFDGKKNLQDDLNLHRNTNDIYSVIDKFQNNNSTFGLLDEAYEFMKKIGKEPKNILNASAIDISGAPKSLAELAKLGQNLKNVMEDYNAKISNVNNIQDKSNIGEVKREETTKPKQQETTKKEIVGDK